MAERLKRVQEEILGVVAALGGIYLALSLFTYSKWDPSFFTHTKDLPGNYGGIVGAYLSDLLISLIGFSSYALPFFLVVFGVKRVLGKEGHKTYLWGAILFLFSFSLMAALFLATFGIETERVSGGGAFGIQGSRLLSRYLSLPGAYIFSLSALLSSIILLSPVSLSSFTLRKRPVPAKPERKEKGLIEEDILISGESAPGAAPGIPLTEAAEHDAAKDEPVVHEPLIRETEPSPPLESTSSRRRSRAEDEGCAEGYELPSVELLTLYEPAERPSKDELLSNSGLLAAKLADFGVEGKVSQVHPGPVVTLYEFEPAPGVKINRVVSLADDLTLSLKAQSTRVYPLPGKAAIGIEVPNRQREIVSLREIVSSDSFRKSGAKLTLALGKNIAGEPVVADLARMPHLLVAGATGAGKSVSINSMVMSILFKASPSEVKMLMIDPKLLELSMYEEIPHLISPVITNPKKAAEALRKMVFEMERRYRLLAEKGARNIDSFNSQVAQEERLPYIIVFIDELADLMFASSNEVEDSITRLAQMARAAGIHLIIATQRPSVDVITGLIKANFPARISFQVFSKIDSRTILDMQGAEQLLGKGDMLFLHPGQKLIRVHGALVTEREITEVTAFVKSQGSPNYSIFEQIPIEEPAQEEPSGDRDEMYYRALEFGESTGEVSISSLQRRFKIGYNRAARIMEMMEEDGLVGPPKGAGKPRDYLGRRV